MKMSGYHAELETIRSILDEPADTAELQIERRCDSIIRDLDELCAMASNAETVDLVQGHRVAVGQMLVRVQLIVSFLMSRQPHPKVVSNNVR